MSGFLLRVQAEGAQQIAADSSFLSMDKKPDPYVTFVLDKVSHTCPQVDDVEPLKYFTWPNAVAEFPLPAEATTTLAWTHSSLVLHVRDKDLLKDRYIGGVAIPLAPLYAARVDNVLCQSRFFALEFADEKWKKKSKAGEVKLTITFVDNRPQPTQPQSPPKHLNAEQCAPLEAEIVSMPLQDQVADVVKSTAPLTSVESTQSIQEPAPVTSSPIVIAPSEVAQLKTDSRVDESKLLVQNFESKTDDIIPTAVALLPSENSSKQSESGGIQPVPKTPVVEKQQAQSELLTRASLPPESENASISLRLMKSIKIELVSGINLSRPTTLGSLFDRKPDPYVIIELYGMSQSSKPLKDVDTKKPVVWSETSFVFTLPQIPPPQPVRKGLAPLDLLIHVKDDNMTKSTYMGGAKVSIAEFVSARGVSNEWFASSSAISGTERTYALSFADEKFTKKRSCGEITVRFHFDIEEKAFSALSNEDDVRNIVSSYPAAQSAALLEDKSNIDGVVLALAETTNSNVAATSAKLRSKPISNDIKLLSVEALCGRKLLKPSAGAIKSLLDRKPDPYVIFTLGSQSKKCAALKDADVAFFEWKNAAQDFEITEKPYPMELLVHVRDEDIIGKDPFMGGARLSMDEVWNAVASYSGDGAADFVQTYPLTFMDEKMSKQHPCGSITLRFRWVYADAPLPTATNPPMAVVASNSVSSKDASASIPPIPDAHVGILSLTNLSINRNMELLDSSLDLYVEFSFIPPDGEKGTAGSITIRSSILTDACKRTKANPNGNIEWKRDQIDVPVIVYATDVKPHIIIELCDKNAITKDTMLATKSLCLANIVLANNSGEKPQIQVDMDMILPSKKSKRDTIGLIFDYRFAPIQPVPMSTTMSDGGGIFTFFITNGEFNFTENECKESASYSVQIQPLDVPKPKQSLFSIGNRDSTMKTNFCSLDLYQRIQWRNCFELKFSSKQLSSIFAKEALELDLQIHESDSKIKSQCIGSISIDVWKLLQNTSKNSTMLQQKTITFGKRGSMEISFGIAFHPAQKLENSKGFKSSIHIPSGNLHLLVSHALNLVSPDEKEELSIELDPEVRVAIEPKYIRRKENPIRSMLKTRPLENAGCNPVWNEYLRLEYRLPSTDKPQTVATGRSPPEDIAEDMRVLPSPIVLLGIYDIQVPGEQGGSKVIGKVEVPLSAFTIQDSDPNGTVSTIPLSIDIFLNDKKTGKLFVEGIFECIANEIETELSPEQKIKSMQCRTTGRGLREKAQAAKKARNEFSIAEQNDDTLQPQVSGRLELHLISLDGLVAADAKGSLTAHVWLSSALDESTELKSKSKMSGDTSVVWDRQLTMYPQDLRTELLRAEILTSTGVVVGSLKLPLSGMQAYPAGHIAHDDHSLFSSTSSSSKSVPALQSGSINLALSFFPDELVFSPWVVSSNDSNDSDQGSIIVTCNRFLFAEKNNLAIDGNQVDELASKFTLLGGTTSSGILSTQFQAVKVSSNLCVEWNEVLQFTLECCISDLSVQSAKIGTCPILRVELLAKKKNARFQDILANAEFSIVAFLSKISKKVTQWLPFYQGDKILGVLLLETMMIPSTTNLNIKDSPNVAVQPGVVCIRFISGRNLVDVDIGGNQDPYIVAKIFPLSALEKKSSSCQSGISLNGGRHPRWNSPIFELHTQDLLTGYVRLDVLDSNEEDHIPDVYIGGVNVALASLFHEDLTLNSWLIHQKTRWKETWLPIYPIVQHGSGDVDLSGEIRVEYRFVSQNYFASVQVQDIGAVTVSSPYTHDNLNTQVLFNSAGTFYFNIVAAKQLPCTKGMQPAVRLSCRRTVFSHLTNIGAKSIENPEWESEIIPMELNDDIGNSSRIIDIEIVDLAARTANASAMAVIAFGSMNIDAFISHPLAVSYMYHRLGAGLVKAQKSYVSCPSVPCLLVGCQFIPKDKVDVSPFQERQNVYRNSYSEGHLHVKILQSVFDSCFSFDPSVLYRRQKLRFRLFSGDSHENICEKLLQCPTTSMRTQLEDNGHVDWTPTNEEDNSNAKNSILFECKTFTNDKEVGGIYCVNPIILGEVIVDADDGSTTSVGEFEVPIFDFVLFGGHLSTSWHSIVSLLNTPPSMVHSMYKDGKCGALQLQIQFLPLLDKNVQLLPSVKADRVIVFCVEVVEARNVYCTTNDLYVINLNLLGSEAETKPNMLKRDISLSNEYRTIVWNDILDFPFSTSTLDTISSYTIKVDLRHAFKTSEMIGSGCCIVSSKFLAQPDINEEDVVTDIVTIKLQANQLLQKSPNSNLNAEVILRITKHVLDNTNETKNLRPAKTQDKSTEKLLRRRGILYVSLDECVKEDQHPLFFSTRLGLSSDNIDNCFGMPITPSQTSAANQNEWSVLRSKEVSVVPIFINHQIEKCALVIAIARKNTSRKDPSDDEIVADGYVVIDSHHLHTLTNEPNVEISHQASVTLVNKSAPLQKLSPQVSLRLLFMNTLQGMIRIHLNKVAPFKIPLSQKLIPVFYVGMRLLSAKSSWTKSSFSKLNTKTGDIEWKTSQTTLLSEAMHLTYENEQDTMEPMLQVVLFSVGNQMNKDDEGIRESSGQISLLSIISSSMNGNAEPLAVEIKMSTTDIRDDGPILYAAIGFTGEECTTEEKQKRIKAEQELQTLALAEGTALLKQTFVVLGGDEDTPINISELKQFLYSGDLHDRNQTARDLLQKAADVESDGDLDKLFVAMDTNGDCMISWDEYAKHMQSIYVLADVAQRTSMISDNRSVDNDEDEVANDDETKEGQATIIIEHDINELESHTYDNQISDVSFQGHISALGPSFVDAVIDEYTLISAANPSENDTHHTSEKEPYELLSPQVRAQVAGQPTRQAIMVSCKEPTSRGSQNLVQKVNSLVNSTFATNKKTVKHVISSFVLDWKVEDVVRWLTNEMELGQYAPAFVSNAINGKLLLTLNEGEIESELGIFTPLHKRKLIIQIREWQNKYDVQVPAHDQQRRSDEKTQGNSMRSKVKDACFTETPAFIKREQLVYQNKKARRDEANRGSRGHGTDTPKVIPAITRILPDAQKHTSMKWATDTHEESFAEAMKDIAATVRPETSASNKEKPIRSDFSMIQIGSVTNTDELLEIVRQRIHQLSIILLPLAHEKRESSSDFGDDDDDPTDSYALNWESEQTGLVLVFQALSHEKNTGISRARFQDGLATLLSIEVSWHQFDILYRRLDRNGDGELSLDEFCGVFRQRAAFQPEELLFLQEALVNVVVNRLESQQWTLGDLFKAFDRDGGGSVSIAEFSTLVRFLLQDPADSQRGQRKKMHVTKHQIYLLMACLDVSADRRITQQEFLRFFFVIWSSRLMAVQDQLLALETSVSGDGTTPGQSNESIEALRASKKMLRKALRMNFSRPFRDAMRCQEVNVPSPFNGLLSRLQLLPNTNTEVTDKQQRPLRVWQVLKGHTSKGERQAALPTQAASKQAQALEDSRRRVQKGKNEVLRTKLTRKPEPQRPNAILQTPTSQVALDATARLKLDHRPLQ